MNAGTVVTTSARCSPRCPIRRDARIIDQLARTESATATELAAVVPVTRQAVNKHLQALGRAGFVTPTRDGREVRYSFTPAPLDEAAAVARRARARSGTGA